MTFTFKLELGDRTVTIAALATSYLDREEGVLGTRADAPSRFTGSV